MTKRKHALCVGNYNGIGMSPGTEKGNKDNKRARQLP